MNTRSVRDRGYRGGAREKSAQGRRCSRSASEASSSLSRCACSECHAGLPAGRPRALCHALCRYPAPHAWGYRRRGRHSGVTRATRDAGPARPSCRASEWLALTHGPLWIGPPPPSVRLESRALVGEGSGGALMILPYHFLVSSHLAECSL